MIQLNSLICLIDAKNRKNIQHLINSAQLGEHYEVYLNALKNENERLAHLAFQDEALAIIKHRISYILLELQELAEAISYHPRPKSKLLLALENIPNRLSAIYLMEGSECELLLEKVLAA